jgi:hypothetical protein
VICNQMNSSSFVQVIKEFKKSSIQYFDSNLNPIPGIPERFLLDLMLFNSIF